MIENLIEDLAYIMMLGAVVSLLFKWIKQPIVLGYIVAGFLVSPNFEPLPSLTSAENIDFWAEIGIVVLLFSLGLEFSFKKLMSCGGSAVITAVVVICGMMFLGIFIGDTLGFSRINCIFLGGMISMQSTTIILKALTDLGLKHRKSSSQVFGVLIVEDLFAVLMMVILSSLAVGGDLHGDELLFSVAKLCFFLVIWFLVGTLALPTLLNKARRFLNDETLLVLSMGLCLGMAVFSVYCGFSLALGAFVMGSILAGTSFAERIEHVVTPVKNLFGAVFFISVGMMVDPDVIVEYWQPILILSVAVICGGLLFGTTGMLLTGQPLKVALQSGFTLTQIGEFSFIIATLGTSLGVLDSTMYPIIVAVSVITTFTTPYFIRMADPACNFAEKHLPARWRFLIDRYATSSAATGSENSMLWKRVLQRYAWRLLLYSIVLIAISLVFSFYVNPWIHKMLPGIWGQVTCCAATLAAMSPFLLGLSFPASKESERQSLMKFNQRNDVPLVAMTVIRLIICAAFIVFVISYHFGLPTGSALGISIFVLGFIFVSRRTRHRLARIESRFLNNLNERELRRSGRNNNLVSDMHVAYGTVGYDFPYVGDRLCISNIGQKYGINVSSIQRGGALIPVPGGDERLFPGDLVGVIGTEEKIAAFMNDLELGSEESGTAASAEEVKLTQVTLSQTSPLIGKTLSEANPRALHRALIVAIQRNGEFIKISSSEIFQTGDIVWFIAQPSTLKTFT